MATTNSILALGTTVLSTVSSGFSLNTGSVLIGLEAGLELTAINNVFIGNTAGSKSTYVSESIFIGNFAGQYIETGKKSIIIGEDKSTTYLNKNNIVSIGYNSIDDNSIGIGSNIISAGTNNVLVGKNISAYASKAFSYGQDLAIKSSDCFRDTFIYTSNSILLEGFQRVGLINIKSNTNYYSSNLFFISYEIDQSIRGENTVFNKETDIIFQFKPVENQVFDFNLGFCEDNNKLFNFNFKSNQIQYTNIRQGISQTIIMKDAYIYGDYNIVHIINNDKNYNALSIYINPIYDGYTVNKNGSINYSQGLIYNITNNKINNIKLDYSLGASHNAINSNYIFTSSYRSYYYSHTTSNVNIIPDYTTFNNASTSLSFRDFVISVNDIKRDNIYNIACGKNINIKGNNNICIGNNQGVLGNNAIIMGNDLCTNRSFNDCTNTIIIGSSNFIDNFSQHSIVVGNNNFNIPYTEDDFQTFLSKRPVIIGSDIDNIEYHLNINDTIVKYKDRWSSNQLLLAGLENELVAVGYTSAHRVPIRNIYQISYSSNTTTSVETSNWTSNYFVDGRLYTAQKSAQITRTTTTLIDQNPIVLDDNIYGLYIKQGLYSDKVSIYNSSNYHLELYYPENIKKNIKYSLPDTLNNIQNTNPHFLSYEIYGDEHRLIWDTFNNAFVNTDITAKKITADEFAGNGAKLYSVNLSDRDTSMLKEGETNLYYTAQRVGVIAQASNCKAMNYTLATSNKLVNRIAELRTDNIREGEINLYFTQDRFDEKLLTKTLDNIYNGTSNRFITNDIYTNNLLITGTLTVGKIQVLGIDFPNIGVPVSYASKDEVTILRQQVADLIDHVTSLQNRISELENQA